jgi:enoyl-CoA hydratase/carnithine racemase
MSNVVATRSMVAWYWSLTRANRMALSAARIHAQEGLRAHFANRSDDEVVALTSATKVLQEVTGALQSELPR